MTRFVSWSRSSFSVKPSVSWGVETGVGGWVVVSGPLILPVYPPTSCTNRGRPQRQQWVISSNLFLRSSDFCFLPSRSKPSPQLSSRSRPGSWTSSVSEDIDDEADVQSQMGSHLGEKCCSELELDGSTSVWSWWNIRVHWTASWPTLTTDVVVGCGYTLAANRCDWVSFSLEISVVFKNIENVFSVQENERNV